MRFQVIEVKKSSSKICPLVEFRILDTAMYGEVKYYSTKFIKKYDSYEYLETAGQWVSDGDCKPYTFAHKFHAELFAMSLETSALEVVIASERERVGE